MLKVYLAKLSSYKEEYLNSLKKEELAKVNRYHKEVYDKISPLMTEEEKVWLKEACREIKG